jgi:hypothetical protein
MNQQNLFYPLIDKSDRNLFANLQKAIKGKYSFIGTKAEKVFFIKSLLCLQMLKDYRAPLRAINDHLSEKTDLKVINDAVKSNKFVIDYSWAVWTRDKEMGRLAKKLFKSPLKIIGTDREFDEFVLRYLVSIWLVAWEGPLYALLQSTKNGRVDLKELNKIMSLWDFTKIFVSYKKFIKLN